MLDIKKHTKKHMEFAKKASKGCYPNKEVARIGSSFGIGVGSILIGTGIYGVIKGSGFSIGCLVAGTVTCVSNYVNIKRINKKG